MSSSTDQIGKEVQKFLGQFLEHHTVCSIRVFVTLSEGGQSKGTSFGNGDFYSMMGYVGEWLETQREESRIQARRHHEEEP